MRFEESPLVFERADLSRFRRRYKPKPEREQPRPTGSRVLNLSERLHSISENAVAASCDQRRPEPGFGQIMGRSHVLNSSANAHRAHSTDRFQSPGAWEAMMNLTDVGANDNCDGKASAIATVVELSARFAHKLNEPLMSVLANAQAADRWLAANPPNLKEVNASIKGILRDARAVNETIQSIRALFNPESFDTKEANIPDLVSEAVRLVQEDPNKRGVPIDSCFDENLPQISADPIQIQRVFVNLISNAIEAMNVTRIPPLVKVRAAITNHGERLIQVIDNGPGFGDTEKIFGAFVTSRKRGLGIGLAVSRSIVEAHGGRLWAENNPNGGATFNVALPLRP